MASEMLQAFCLGFFCSLMLSVNADKEVQITLKTLKSDLDMILEKTPSPSTVNIEYADDAVLSLKVVPESRSQGMYIMVDGMLNIELPNGYIVQKNNIQYQDGSFGLPSNYNCASIIIRRDTHKRVKPALGIIRYVSVTQLTKDLQAETKDLEKTKYYSSTISTWPSFRIGQESTFMMFQPQDERFILKEPLKGISLHAGNFIDDGCCAIFKLIKSNFEGSYDENTREKHRGFDVFFDVWYDPTSKLFGSSSGSMDWVDAVRIYEEWSQDLKKNDTPAVQIRRGEDIRKRVFDQDMNMAFQYLHSEVYENVLIDYANNIVLDVRRGDNGEHRYVTATGTTRSGPTESKLKNVKAYYDLEKLEYSDEIETNEEFAPEMYEETSFSLKYIDWETFENHLKGMWTALQGGCTQDQTRIYVFSMYGGNIQAKYDCSNRILTLPGTISVLADIPKFHKAEFIKLENVRYRELIGVESLSLSTDVTPIAIQLRQPSPFKCSGVVYRDAELFKDAMKFINTIIVNNGKSKSTIDTPTQGTIILNEKMLFDMKLSQDQSVEIHGNFEIQSESELISHKTLTYNDAGLSTLSGVAVTNVSISHTYKKINPESLREYVIASKYLSIQSMTLYLRKVLNENLKRCISRQEKGSWFKLVQHRKFALSGFCDCSERVILVEGQFRALLLNKDNGKTEVHTARSIRDIIYIEKGKLLIPGSGTFDNVYAVSVPKMANWDVERKSFGAPITIDTDIFLVFKSQGDNCI